MKIRTKLIIIISIIIVGLSSYVGAYIYARKDKIHLFDKKENQTELIKKVGNEQKKEDTENNDHTDQSNIELSSSYGQEIEIAVNENTTLSFYILSEDEITYTLIAKDSLESTPYYTSDTCNETTQSECNISSDYINRVLEQKTSNWTNVGNIRIPTYDEIQEYGQFDADMKTKVEFIANTSYWVSYESNEKEIQDMYYVNKDSKGLEVDKVYNFHELIPIIVILKDKVK